MPTMSAPHMRYILLSALLENLGPSMHTYVPVSWCFMLRFFATWITVLCSCGHMGSATVMWQTFCSAIV